MYLRKPRTRPPLAHILDASRKEEAVERFGAHTSHNLNLAQKLADEQSGAQLRGSA
jgi:hypothetical protein